MLVACFGISRVCFVTVPPACGGSPLSSVPCSGLSFALVSFRAQPTVHPLSPPVHPGALPCASRRMPCMVACSECLYLPSFSTVSINQLFAYSTVTPPHQEKHPMSVTPYSRPTRPSYYESRVVCALVDNRRQAKSQQTTDTHTLHAGDETLHAIAEPCLLLGY